MDLSTSTSRDWESSILSKARLPEWARRANASFSFGAAGRLACQSLRTSAYSHGNYATVRNEHKARAHVRIGFCRLGSFFTLARTGFCPQKSGQLAGAVWIGDFAFPIETEDASISGRAEKSGARAQTDGQLEPFHHSPWTICDRCYMQMRVAANQGVIGVGYQGAMIAETRAAAQSIRVTGQTCVPRASDEPSVGPRTQVPWTRLCVAERLHLPGRTINSRRVASRNAPKYGTCKGGTPSPSHRASEIPTLCEARKLGRPCNPRGREEEERHVLQARLTLPIGRNSVPAQRAVLPYLPGPLRISDLPNDETSFLSWLQPFAV